jgi:cytochrome b6-f complex iron-sulfur subunit
MADKKKMSVEDILAACRTADGASSSAPPATSPAESGPGTKQGGSAKATSSGTATAKKPSEMSVADVLAAARGQSSAKSTGDAAAGGTAKTPGAKPKPAAKEAAQPKVSAKSAVSAAKLAPMDTSSILAAARSGAKPGPMSKAEAAEKSKVAVGKVEAARPILPPLPERPAYAQPTPRPAAASPDDRRGFMSILLGSFLAVGFTSLMLTNLLWTLGLARFMFPNILIEPPSKFKVGFPADFAPGTVDERFKAQFGVWLTNVEYEGQQQIVALKTVCTHLGCTPNWLEAEQKFKCPCHGSGFYKEGINFEGPAPRPLERYAIHLADDGQLEIDKSKIFQQEMGQWNDPASFVPV